MSNTILKPAVTSVKELAQNSSVLTIEPLASGYGQTLGNSLRRVLLSSIEGSAITALKSTVLAMNLLPSLALRKTCLRLCLTSRALY